MSDPVTPLGGASYDGAARVAEAPRAGMLTLRGPLPDAAFARPVAEVAGLALPSRGAISLAADRRLGWMSPDELILMLPPEEVAPARARLAAALSGIHHLVADVTDARALIHVSGEPRAVRETLAKLAPVDFSAAAFPPGHLRRSRLAQVPAAFWCEAEDRFGVMCFRSVVDYAFRALSLAAAPEGRVGVL